MGIWANSDIPSSKGLFPATRKIDACTKELPQLPSGEHYLSNFIARYKTTAIVVLSLEITSRQSFCVHQRQNQTITKIAE